MSEISISLKNVSKCYKRYARPVDRLKELILPTKNRFEEFWALRDINLDVPKGETLGIIGRNGSGKSTLLQIIAGTLTPTTGQVIVNGRVSALLELGSGFNPEFTGRQNVFFNGRLLGLSKQEIEAKFDEIAAFAEIGDFIDQPVKTYSSGMFVRLAFAVAVNVDPEILIVDEALAVGDVVFQHRCMRRMRNLMDSGVTTLFVSHDPGAVKTLCKQAVMIQDGKLKAHGLPNQVLIQYMKVCTELELGLDVPDALKDDQEPQSLKQKNLEKEEFPYSRRGDRRALIKKAQLLSSAASSQDKEVPTFDFNEEVVLLINLHIHEFLEECIVGFYICDKNGNELLGSNTYEEGVNLENLHIGDKLQIKFKFHLPLKPGSYSLTVAGAENYSSITFDWIDNAIVFQVLPPNTGKIIHSLVDIPIDIEISQPIPYSLSMQEA